MSAPLGEGLAHARHLLSDFLPAPEAEREVRMIATHVLGVSSASLLARLDEPWPEGDAEARFAAALAARQKRQPLSQILGITEFYGRPFHVTPDVLTPRPDTETLVDAALQVPFSRVLDLGVGSGCILATLLAERPSATGIGADISQAALDVAARNLARHGLESRAALVQSDWLSAIDGSFDLIVSNPPYIAQAELAELSPEVRDWDPLVALTPGVDGLAAYRAMINAAIAALNPGGHLLVEIGRSQGPDVAGLFTAAGLDQVAVHPDINGQDRVVSGQTA